MLVKLNEIEAKGEHFELSEKTQELNERIHGEFGKIPYRVDVQIVPVDQSFLMTGSVICAVTEICSRCGTEFSIDVSEKINEILYISDFVERNSMFSKANNFSDRSDVERGATELRTHEFHLDQFVFEVISTSIPSRPLCGHSPTGRFDRCKKFGDELYSYDEQMSEIADKNPFHSLKDFIKK